MAMESSHGEEGTSWKNLENLKRAEAKRIRDDAAREKQEETQGQLRNYAQMLPRNKGQQMGRISRIMHGRSEVICMDLRNNT